jgi:hypothetical protein
MTVPDSFGAPFQVFWHIKTAVAKQQKTQFLKMTESKNSK